MHQIWNEFPAIDDKQKLSLEIANMTSFAIPDMWMKSAMKLTKMPRSASCDIQRIIETF